MSSSYITPECGVYSLTPNLSVLTESPWSGTEPTMPDPPFNPEEEI